MKKIDGVLCDGIDRPGDYPHFLDETKQGYDRIVHLKSGDVLTVFNDAARQDVLWMGALDMEYNVDEDMELQKGVNREKWMNMFYKGKPATLIVK